MQTVVTTSRVHGYGGPDYVHVTDDKVRAKEPHVFPELGANEAWKKGSPEQTYKELFDDDIIEYNKGKKPSRQIDGYRGYMEKVKADTRGKLATKRGKNGQRIVDTSVEKGKKLYYELVVSVGNTVDRQKDADGHIMYDDADHLIMPGRLPEALNRAVCLKYFQTFEQRNPHMRIMTANYHCDEGFRNNRGVLEQDTEHLSILYVPYADGGKTGLAHQNSIGKALKQQGYDRYDEWQKAERDYIEQLTRDLAPQYGIDVEFVHPVQDRQREATPDDPREFKAFQDEKAAVAEAWADVRTAQREAQEKTQEASDREQNAAEREQQMDAEVQSQVAALRKQMDEENEKELAKEKEKLKAQNASEMQDMREEMDKLKASVDAIPSVDTDSYEYSQKVTGTVRQQLNAPLTRNGQPWKYQDGRPVTIWSQYGRQITNAVQSALILNGDDDPRKKTVVSKQTIQKDIQRFNEKFGTQQEQEGEYEPS
ncbi:MAG: hypothetical protein LUC25_04205 [Ruminococcus sp.]|nr:hypothetical protein [Ruminococcus sp.]